MQWQWFFLKSRGAGNNFSVKFKNFKKKKKKKLCETISARIWHPLKDHGVGVFNVLLLWEIVLELIVQPMLCQ
jgi:hypothetical protein